MSVPGGTGNKTVKVTEVFFQQDRIHVKPSHGTYDMIYRAARGVYWDPKTRSLYYNGPISRGNALQLIQEAMLEEYGIVLEI